MLLATSEQIKLIDQRVSKLLSISTYELIGRAGDAIARVVQKHIANGSKIVVLAGKGNNGADGYAAAKRLLSNYQVVVYDIFGAGQHGNDGKCYLEEFVRDGGILNPYSDPESLKSDLSDADCIIDAIFGIGVSGDLPTFLIDIAELLRAVKNAVKIAVDIPLGVISDDGRVDERFAYAADATVSLCLLKPCNVSYPAKAYIGKLHYDDIGLNVTDVIPKEEFLYHLIDEQNIKELLPNRDDNTNKGSFGKLLLITGSSEYQGAGRLALEAALRGGVGLVAYLGEKDQNDSLLREFPETIFKQRKAFENMQQEDVNDIIALAGKYDSVLIGSGCGRSDGLLTLVKSLLDSYKGNLILDADAINVLAEEPNESRCLIASSEARVIITPHPLEFARIRGCTAADVNRDRIRLAREFSKECGCITVLKGAATVSTDGDAVYINSSGSSALAKAGSGDVLAGFLSSLCTSSGALLQSAAAAVYIHARAADVLAEELSQYGVTPSDLPRQIAREIVKCKHN